MDMIRKAVRRCSVASTSSSECKQPQPQPQQQSIDATYPKRQPHDNAAETAASLVSEITWSFLDKSDISPSSPQYREMESLISAKIRPAVSRLVYFFNAYIEAREAAPSPESSASSLGTSSVPSSNSSGSGSGSERSSSDDDETDATSPASASPSPCASSLIQCQHPIVQFGRPHGLFDSDADLISTHYCYRVLLLLMAMSLRRNTARPADSVEQDTPPPSSPPLLNTDEEKTAEQLLESIDNSNIRVLFYLGTPDDVLSWIRSNRTNNAAERDKLDAKIDKLLRDFTGDGKPDARSLAALPPTLSWWGAAAEAEIHQRGLGRLLRRKISLDWKTWLSPMKTQT